jgi:hypothetical protein
LLKITFEEMAMSTIENCYESFLGIFAISYPWWLTMLLHFVNDEIMSLFVEQCSGMNDNKAIVDWSLDPPSPFRW